MHDHTVPPPLRVHRAFCSLLLNGKDDKIKDNRIKKGSMNCAIFQKSNVDAKARGRSHTMSRRASRPYKDTERAGGRGKTHSAIY